VGKKGKQIKILKTHAQVLYISGKEVLFLFFPELL
jgi:hypothetical protein